MKKSSELIINPDGSIYHLRLHPGDIADTVITVGDQDRVGQVSRHFDRLELKKENREFVTHTGYVGSERISVISTGIGTDNVDIVMNELHALVNLDLGSGELLKERRRLNFIRLGTSGTVREDIPVGSVLASSAALGFDGLIHFYEGYDQDDKVEGLLMSSPELRDLPRPYYIPADRSLMEHFSGVYTHSGVTVTAPGFYAPQGRSVNLPIKLRNFTEVLSRSEIDGVHITNIEMETAGIYGLAYLLGHRAISISAILANRLTGEFSLKPEKVIERMIEGSMEKIQKTVSKGY